MENTMKIAYMSDLHLEFGNDFIPSVDADVLVLAGDITTAVGFLDNPKKAELYHTFFREVSNRYRHVIYIGGNHEVYGWKYDSAHMMHVYHALSCYQNIKVIPTYGYKNIDGVRFVCGTLWTSMRNGDPIYARIAKKGMNDFRWITPEEVVITHEETVKAFDVLSRGHDKVVVVSHHAPSHASVHPMYVGNELNDCYYTDLSEFILDRPQIKYWIHGHMHHRVDYMIGDTRVVANPFGYKHHGENTGFDPQATFEI
jgi:Icc-related predicted phosphoesterase